ncbi:hypothetical protein [Paenibacillus sp. YPG26]|uniref:hypothetical protein n=1 Tax=Paenibacillus sp. YPG26 TaxID=2878915 RepID=UPI00203A7742|nr:hypothetical protein [Paenibacillus sp. YPG26]USB32534.1 hypothetical protein LDO05_14690 [Paenibacillus sp. YPG26]
MEWYNRSKNKGVFLLILILIIFGLFKFFEGDSEEAPVSGDTTSTTSVTAKEVTKPGVEEPAFDWSKADVTEENVRKALANEVTAVSIPLNETTFRRFAASSDTTGEYIEITVNPGAFWDSKDFVKIDGGSLIAYSKILFNNPKVYEVSVSVNIDNVSGGENDGVYISWRREQVKDVDLEKVLDNVIGDYTVPYQLARKYSIQKELYDSLESFDLPKDNNL